MDQRIGIEYVVTGHDTVIQANKQLATSLTHVTNKIKHASSELISFTGSVSSSISKLSRVSEVFKGLKDLQGGSRGNASSPFSIDSRPLETATSRTISLTDKLERLVRPARDATTAMNELTSAVGKYNGAIASSGNLAPKLSRASTPGGLSHTTDTVQPDRGSKWSPFGMGSLGFMARWWGAYQAAHLAKLGITDVMLGKSREELAAGLGELSSVSFTPSQKKQTEMAAQQFSSRFWTTTTEQYVQAMSQTASAFSIGDLGFEPLRKMNDAVLAFGMISKIKPEAASELMSQNLRAVLAFQPKNVREMLETGGAATVKGYEKFGDLDMGSLMEKMAGQYSKAIEISSIWGSGIANTFRHSLPVMLNMGWNPAAALALAGTAKDLGFHAGQAGRGFKDLFTSFPTSAAKSILMGSGHWQDETKIRASGDSEGARQAHLQNQMLLKEITPLIAQQMSTPEGMRRIMPIIGRFTKLAQKQGWRVIEDMGASKNFLPIIQAFQQGGALERFNEMMQKVSGDNVDAEMYAKAKATLDDAGTAWQRISGAVSNYFEAIADTDLAHKAASIFDIFNEGATEMRLKQAMTKMTAEGRMPQEKTAFIENMYPRWKDKFGEEKADQLRALGYHLGEIPFMKNKKGEAVPSSNEYFRSIASTDDIERMPWGLKHVWKYGYQALNGMLPMQKEMNKLDQQVSDKYGLTVAPPQFHAPWPLNPTSANIKLPIDQGLQKNFTPAPERSLAGNIFDWLWGPAVLGDFDRAKLAAANNNVPYVAPYSPQAQQPIIQAVPEEGPGGNFSFKFYIGQQELRQVFIEMIEENRSRGYQSFGSDPMGFNTGVE